MLGGADFLGRDAELPGVASGFPAALRERADLRYLRAMIDLHAKKKPGHSGREA